MIPSLNNIKAWKKLFFKSWKQAQLDEMPISPQAVRQATEENTQVLDEVKEKMKNGWIMKNLQSNLHPFFEEH